MAWALRRARYPGSARGRGAPLIGIVIVLVVLGHYAYKHWFAAPLAPLTGYARVADADTVQIAQARIRLEGIDAVELHQDCTDAKGAVWACGDKAWRAVRDHVAGHELRCEPTGRDRFERFVAICFLPDGSNLNAWIVRQGWAVMALPSRAFQTEQDEARAAKRGIWAGHFAMPWEWRKEHPRSN